MTSSAHPQRVSPFRPFRHRAFATVWTGSGTHEGDWESPAGTIAPTGKQVRWTGTTTLRLSEGRISDVIATSWGHLGILQQLEAVDVTEPRTGA